MYKTWIAMAGITAFIYLGLGGIWLESESQCESLTQENQGEKAFPVCLASAKQGDAYAQNIIGVSYASGEGVQQDSVESLKWFHKSAKQGFAKAQSNIGLSFLMSDGVNQSYVAAVQWWNMAANQGEPHAQYNLAVSYESGCGVEQNTKLAMKWYLKSAFSYLKLGMFNPAMNSLKQGFLL